MQKVAIFWSMRGCEIQGYTNIVYRQSTYVIAGAPFMDADTHSCLIFVLAGSTMAEICV